MLGLEHEFVDPVSRPPISLAIIAASIKYVSTAIVIDEPLLSTRKDFLRRRIAFGVDAENMTKVYLVARILFCLLALETLIHDFLTMLHGFPELKGWHRCHMPAMVLAFSPNSVAALAAAFSTEVKIFWLKELPLRSDGLGWICDVLAIAYANGLGLLYILPFCFILLPYGVVGGITVLFCMVRDAASLLPWRFFGHNHVNEVWIALPILFALILRTAMNISLIIGQEQFVRWRYPEEAARLSAEEEVSLMTVKMPQQVSASVVGLARSVVAASSPAIAANNAAREVRATMGIAGGAQEEPTEEPLVDFSEGRATESSSEEPDQSILNNHIMAWVCYMKTSIVVSVPIIQMFVIVAARVFVGRSLWDAGLETFKERSWGHYFHNIWHEGFQGSFRLLWTFI